MDYSELFKNEGNFQAPKTGVYISFDKINAEEKTLLMEMGKRAWRLVSDLQKRAKHPELMRVPAPTWAACEIACAHLSRNLDLRAMFQADDLAFMADYVEIVKHINRATGTVSGNARLRFAVDSTRLL